MFGVDVFRSSVSGCGRAAALILLCAVVANCSAPSLSMPSFSSMFGSGAANANASAGEAPPANFECPSVQIRQGAATLSASSTGWNRKAPAVVSTWPTVSPSRDLPSVISSR